jgi:hypothetical protein
MRTIVNFLKLNRQEKGRWGKNMLHAKFLCKLPRFFETLQIYQRLESSHLTNIEFGKIYPDFENSSN